MKWSIARLMPVTLFLVAASCTDRQPVAPTQNPGFTARGPAAAADRSGSGGGRHVVSLTGTETQAFDQAVAALGGTIERRHSEIDAVSVRGLSGAAVTALAARSDVFSVDADATVQWIPTPAAIFHHAEQRPLANPGTDQSGAAFFPFQWNLQVIQAPAAWAASHGGRHRLVCVLDTGVDPDHVDLSGKIDLRKSISFVDSEPTIQDFNTHGTFVSSIISSNGLGVASVAPDAELCAIKVLGASGSGSFDDVISGILFATAEHADVINMSLGAIIDLSQPGAKNLVRSLQRAVSFATRHGVTVVVAAGNDGLNLDEDPKNQLEVPGQLDDVISVGATAPFNQANFDLLASYSNFGGKTGITMVAPGGDLLAGGNQLDLVLGACSHTQVSLPFTCGTSDFLLGAGTSFASPHVAGAAAEIDFRRGAAGDVAGCLTRGADNVGPKKIFGAGRLNVLGAIKCR